MLVTLRVFYVTASMKLWDEASILGQKTVPHTDTWPRSEDHSLKRSWSPATRRKFLGCLSLHNWKLQQEAYTANWYFQIVLFKFFTDQWLAVAIFLRNQQVFHMYFKCPLVFRKEESIVTVLYRGKCSTIHHDIQPSLWYSEKSL